MGDLFSPTIRIGSPPAGKPFASEDPDDARGGVGSYDFAAIASWLSIKPYIFK